MGINLIVFDRLRKPRGTILQETLFEENSMKSNSVRLWLVAFVLGWLFDFLFWEHEPGINFAIFVILCLAGGTYLLLGVEKAKPARSALWLLIPILFFAAVTFIRADPLTTFLAHFLTLFLLAVFVMTYLGGRWIWYRIWDYVTGFIKLGGNMLIKPLTFSAEIRKERAERGDPPRRTIMPVVRGLLIALPVVAIFASLLASADAVFEARLQDFLDLLRIDNLAEYIFRLSYILIGAYLLVGVFIHAAWHSRDEEQGRDTKSAIGQFLGFTESTIVLGSVALLFILFVIIQFQYFFGGQANIHIDGYTYSEYARRGFGELVAVAFFSLLLILGAGAITRRETEPQRRIFSGLSVGIVVLVLVILVSAFKRLVLYETAYGFSELRTYTHVFMIWLGLLLVTTVILEIIRRERMFALAALIASIGFAATLPILNVDAFIVQKNIARELQGLKNYGSPSGRAELDSGYFLNLSDDAIPHIARAFETADLPESLREELGAVLQCKAGRSQADEDDSWQSFKISRWNAEKVLTQLKDDLKNYILNDEKLPTNVVTPSGKTFNCFSGYMD